MQSPDSKTTHEIILKRAWERIELAYEKAVSEGLRNPVVLVLDLQDDTARRVAEASGHDQRIDDVVAEAEKRGDLDRLAFGICPAMSPPSALAAFPDVAASLNEMLPPWTFYTVVVAAGSASLAVTPCP